MSTQYLVRDWPQLDEVWSLVKESASTSRRSVDGSQVVLKFDGPTPPEFEGDTLMTHEQALALMDTEAWKHPDPDPEDGE